jgi:hypothetical protein
MPVFSTNRVFMGLLTTEYRGSDPEMSAFARNVRENFQRLQWFLWPANQSPPAPGTVRVVTGISGSNFTTSILTVLGFTNGANVAVGTQATVLTSAGTGSTSLVFGRQTVTVLLATNIADTTLSGTNCT